MKSSEATAIACASSVTRQSSSSLPVSAASTTRRASRTAIGAFAAICSPSARAAARARPGSTSSLTSPKWAARSALNGSPVSASCIATLRGSARGRRNRPPADAMRERLTSGIPNVAAVDATTRSHANTISVPPAKAGPSTAAMTGLTRSRRVKPAKPPRSVENVRPSPRSMALRSAPGAEDRAGPGQDTDRRLGVGLQPIDRCLETVGNGSVDRIARVRPVDRDDRHTSRQPIRDRAVDALVSQRAPAATPARSRSWRAGGAAARRGRRGGDPGAGRASLRTGPATRGGRGWLRGSGASRGRTRCDRSACAGCRT